MSVDGVLSIINMWYIKEGHFAVEQLSWIHLQARKQRREDRGKVMQRILQTVVRISVSRRDGEDSIMKTGIVPGR